MAGCVCLFSLLFDSGEQRHQCMSDPSCIVTKLFPTKAGCAVYCVGQPPFLYVQQQALSSAHWKRAPFVLYCLRPVNSISVLSCTMCTGAHPGFWPGSQITKTYRSGGPNHKRSTFWHFLHDFGNESSLGEGPWFPEDFPRV